MEKLISIDLKAPMGFLKKPDINEGGSGQLYLTFNMLHKPALLGILGAILGLDGYKKKNELPEYQIKLKDLLIGIQPMYSNRGHYAKTIIKYTNTVGYANVDGNLIISEQILLRPTFRCFLLLDTNNELHVNLDTKLKHSEAEYIPYLGKNEFHLWWENYKVYQYEPFSFDRDYRIRTIIRKGNQIVKTMRTETGFRFPFILGDAKSEPEFITFEELPIGFDPDLKQYQREMFAYSNYTFKREFHLDGLYLLKEEELVIQLF